ncbi:uncharacterized protein J8A68_002586 [[Candida] subhashii]|uniref:PH domain-containing protein n=1 Tax=[Candida] subhashii TaxID=561895 RepID=A0A8J5QKN9_9ASCO|nr:uncharacterized protein J8A68_002586 [[Candida] subhashii]KAG7663898.1 hypothetical protein J8A68_002586 [[Candida] subhashii]
MPYEHHNPLTVALPFNFTTINDYPTEIMANRFQAYRAIIKELVTYLREYASVEGEIVRQQLRLQQAIGFNNPSSNNSVSSGNTSASANGLNKEDANLINRFFLPVGNGSIQDVSTILAKYHSQNVSNSSKTLKDINNIIIPKLEELRKDLLVKIKEIKNLQNDFKTNLGKELAETQSLISQYNKAIEFCNKLDYKNSTGHSDGVENSKNDPYLVKIKLDRQLKRQMTEENYLYDAFANLQSSGGKLESIVVGEIQNYLSMFLNLISNENSTLPTFLIPNLNNGFLSKETTFEYDAFISRNLPSANLGVTAVSNNTSTIKNGTFIDLSIPRRKLNDLNIPNFNSGLNVSVRQGYLDRRSKYLKNYSTSWYVLTCSYIHEFKSNDRKKDPQPVMSLSLDSCTVTEHSRDDGKPTGSYKFYLVSKSSSGLIHRSHNWTFKTDTYENMIGWYDDIKKLSGLPTPSSRARTIGRNANADGAVSLTPSTTLHSRSRSLKTVSTSGTNPLPRQRPLSQATSIANANRLSSTFSQKNSQSPRLANMINSDGTIITPVESYVDTPKREQAITPRSSVQQLPPQQQQPQPQHQVAPQPYQGYQVVPTDSITSSIRPGAHLVQPSSQYATPPSGYHYYIPQQAQQFYDPVQQQYYTITPSMPSQTITPTTQPPQQDQQQKQQQQQQLPVVQPQYFPSSPQPNTPPQFVPMPGSPGQQQQQYPGYFVAQPQHQQQQQGGIGLPYPTTYDATSPTDINEGPVLDGQKGDHEGDVDSGSVKRHVETTTHNGDISITVTDEEK